MVEQRTKEAKDMGPLDVDIPTSGCLKLDRVGLDERTVDQHSVEVKVLCAQLIPVLTRTQIFAPPDYRSCLLRDEIVDRATSAPCY